jgi:hypothetical protein
MSAKHKKGGKKSDSAATPANTPASGATRADLDSALPAHAGGAAVSAGDNVSWIDSTDPKKRKIGQIVLVGVWIYVAALWLLALDQTFNWGIFGPKIPPLP